MLISLNITTISSIYNLYLFFNVDIILYNIVKLYRKVPKLLTKN